MPSIERLEIIALAAPAYLWLTATIFLPLLAMALFQLSHHRRRWVAASPASPLRTMSAFFTKPIYWFNAWRSIELGIYVTAICCLVGYPAALALARYVTGRWREAIFLLIMLPFWSNALVRTFSWTMVLRGRLPRHPLHLFGDRHRPGPRLPALCHPHLLHLAPGDRRLADRGGAQPRRLRDADLRRVILPLSLPGLLAAVVLIFVPVIGSFMEPRILGGQDGIMLARSSRISSPPCSTGRSARRCPS